MKQDITTIQHVHLLVDSFYSLIREDQLLAPIFNNIIQDRWPQHLNKMYRFWQTVLLNEHTYHGSPFMPHAQLPVDIPHFEKWVQLFDVTVDLHFQGPNAERAKWQGSRMATLFHSKIQHYQN